MSKIKATKKPSSKKAKKQKDWPVVVYMWAIGLGLAGYLVVGEAIFQSRPHPIHWLAGSIGAAFASAWAGSGIAGAAMYSSLTDIARKE